MLFIHHPISKTRQIAYIVTMMRRTVSRIPLELIVWTTGLIYLALIDPHGAVPQFCIYKLAGFSGCPGCGLGSAVSHLLHGELQASWESHPLGGPALAALVLRILQLSRQQFATFKPEKKPV